MNTALLSARKRTPSGDLRAEMSLAGRSVLAWQVAMARALGCERIVCLCDAPFAGILDIQREIEASGGEFHAIRNSLQLVTLLRSDEKLVVIADGLIVDPVFARSVVLKEDHLSRVVLTFPAEDKLAEAHADDFERIDVDRSWAGLLVIRSANAHKLADHAPDGEPVSLLLRLALQSEAPTRSIPISGSHADDWVLANGPDSVERHERMLFEHASPNAVWTAPGTSLANFLVRFAAPIGLQRGALISGGLALLLAVAGAILVSFEFAEVGLISVTFGVFSAALSAGWERLSCNLFNRGASPKYRKLFNVLIDIAVIYSLIQSAGTLSVASLALPIFFVGLARLAFANAPPSIAPFWNDRTLQLAVFVVCAVYGTLSEGLAIFGLAAMLQLMLLQWQNSVEKY